jgi:hypothetical protein
MTLDELRTAIENYIAANPGDWDTVVDIARNSGPPALGSLLPDDAVIYDDITEWYTKIRTEGENLIVLSGDDPMRRLIGFHITTPHGKDLGAHYVSLPTLKAHGQKLPKEVRDMIRYPAGRMKLGELFGKGEMPALS